MKPLFKNLYGKSPGPTLEGKGINVVLNNELIVRIFLSNPFSDLTDFLFGYIIDTGVFVSADAVFSFIIENPHRGLAGNVNDDLFKVF